MLSSFSHAAVPMHLPPEWLFQSWGAKPLCYCTLLTNPHTSCFSPGPKELCQLPHTPNRQHPQQCHAGDRQRCLKRWCCMLTSLLTPNSVLLPGGPIGFNGIFGGVRPLSKPSALHGNLLIVMSGLRLRFYGAIYHE